MIVNRTLFDIPNSGIPCAISRIYVSSQPFCIESFSLHRILWTVYQTAIRHSEYNISNRFDTSPLRIHALSMYWLISLSFYLPSMVCNSMWESARNCLSRTFAFRVRQPLMSASAYLYSSLLNSWNSFQDYSQWKSQLGGYMCVDVCFSHSFSFRVSVLFMCSLLSPSQLCVAVHLCASCAEIISILRIVCTSI